MGRVDRARRQDAQQAGSVSVMPQERFCIELKRAESIDLGLEEVLIVLKIGGHTVIVFRLVKFTTLSSASSRPNRPTGDRVSIGLSAWWLHAQGEVRSWRRVQELSGEELWRHDRSVVVLNPDVLRCHVGEDT